jgi:hypothetical protein
MKRVIGSLAAGGVVCAIAWLNGFDFDHRGFGASFTAYCSVAVALFVYVCPAWNRK